MDIKACRWHFFLAHAAADIHSAESLYDLLIPQSKVFLDSRCLLLGDDWEEELPEAQRNSLITIVLVSSNTHKAYYQQEEIAGAIEMARTGKDKHRVVPVFLEDSSDINSVPYGLRLKQGLSISKNGGLPGISRSLLDLLEKLQQPQTFIGDDKGLKDLEADSGKRENENSVTNNLNEVKGQGFPDGLNKQLNNNPIQQPQLAQQSPTQPPPFDANPANGFVMRCVFVNDPNAYFVTNTDVIVMIDPFGKAIPIGRRIPPIFPNLAWMYQTNASMYGVTFQGYIFATFPNGQTLQIGYVTNP
jgi:hypothetical protein